MRKDDMWFRNKTAQNTASNLGRMQVFIASGNKSLRELKSENKDGNKIFIVGKSVIGDDSVI